MNELAYQGLIYSLDESLTKTKLRTGEYTKNITTDKLSRWLDDNHVQYQVDGMSAFHFKFHFIRSKPYVIYYQWNISLLDKQLLAIVWPRRKSSYADRVLSDLFAHLDGHDLATISWMAPWVDMLCHKLSIEKNIPTIAVLWWWLAHFLKKQSPIIEQIVANGGLVLSEFPLNKAPTHYTFPQRNRIIAGLADRVFLPEAAQWSGSLITVDFACKMNKPVYGTPSGIYSPPSMGLNEKIGRGDVKAVWDIKSFVHETLGFCWSNKKEHSSLTVTQQHIVSFLKKNQDASVQEMVIWLDVATASLMAELSILEMDGRVLEGEWKKYMLAS